MKSYLAKAFDRANLDHYSELMVLQSAAGFYIGSVYHNPEGFSEPGSRDSGYYPTRHEAEMALEKKDWVQREYP